MNSIDCARAASLFDVLIYATEEKMLKEAEALDQENEMQKARMKSKRK